MSVKSEPEPKFAKGRSRRHSPSLNWSKPKYPGLEPRYSLSTNFLLELIEPSAREVLIFLDSCQERRARGGVSEERREHGKAIYHVFKLGFMKRKFIICNNDINYCRVVKSLVIFFCQP